MPITLLFSTFANLVLGLIGTLLIEVDVGEYYSGPDGFAYLVVLANFRFELDRRRHFCVHAASQMSGVDYQPIVATGPKRRG